jgi:phosphoribosyl-AMP cyclohydrolase / phosphoribosyl-ATP pyrophosphohydrolase
MKVNFNKGLIPAIIQDNVTGKVLMQGYMNAEAFQKTKEEGRVTFFSRSKNRLWTKGESSGNYLKVVKILVDCDQDSILIKVNPEGPACHTGSDTCWGEENNESPLQIIQSLEELIRQRKDSNEDNSYTVSLFREGLNKIVQKVGEEAVELIIEAKDNDRERFLNEAADLLFHYLVLLTAKGYTLQSVTKVLEGRRK